MDKELIWKILAEEQGCKLSGEDCNGKSCLRYYTCKGIASAITKLFKERIGDDEEVKGYDHTCGDFICSGCQSDGRNQLRAELRKKVGER
jgi:hypothetical protein